MGRIQFKRLSQPWLLLAILIGCALVLSWAVTLPNALGDDHQGRILGRLVLHADNFLVKGWTGSNFGADWEPYSQAAYAHHPPLPHFLHIAVAWIQGGATATGARMVEFLGGLSAVLLLGAIVRKITDSWLAVAWGLSGLAVSGYFLYFGQGLGLVFPLAYFLIREHARGRSDHWVAALIAIGAIGALQSWNGAFIIGLVAIYDLIHSDYRRALSTGIGVAIGLALDLLWIESAAGINALVGHVEARAAASDYTVIEWIVRQGGFYLRFESLPTFLLTAIALLAGLRHRSFRPLVGSIFLSVVIFAIVFDQNAWVHEYWNWRISVVLALGLGALGGWWAAQELRDLRHSLIIAILIGAALLPLLRIDSDTYQTQFTQSSKAGTLVDQAVFPENQKVAWHYGGIAGPRWYSWYTGLPTAHFRTGTPHDSDALVLVKRDQRDGLGGVEPLQVLGDYALIEASALAEALRDE